jgi:hypothetical protein
VAKRLPERFGGTPNYARVIEQHRPVVRLLEEQLVGNVARPIWIVWGTIGIVFVIACANVANLFVVRTASALVLLVGAGLLARSFWQLSRSRAAPRLPAGAH